MKKSAEVDAFLAKLKDPLKPAIHAVREITLAASPKISEGIKWNSASFRTTEWFFAVRIRRGQVYGVLHLGAKVGKSVDGEIPDPQGLLEWLGKDRAVVQFKDLASVKASKAALTKVLRAWIGYVK